MESPSQSKGGGARGGSLGGHPELANGALELATLWRGGVRAAVGRLLLAAQGGCAIYIHTAVHERESNDGCV